MAGFSSEQRSSLIRLAASLPKGSEPRRAVLRAVKTGTESPPIWTPRAPSPEEIHDAVQQTAQVLKKAPKSYLKNLKRQFLHEVSSIKSMIGKISRGEKPTRHELKAFATLAIEVGIAGLSLHTAGVAGAGYLLGTSVTKHLILSAIHPLLGDAYLATHLAEGVSHVIVASEGDDVSDAVVDEYLARLIRQVGIGLSKLDENDVERVLQVSS